MNPAYLASGGWIASAVGTAAALCVADHLGSGPKTAAELAALTGSSEYAIGRMMRLLCVAGLFEETTDARFANTADAELLRTDHPRSMRHFCMLAAGDYQRIFQEMAHTVATGEPATRTVLGGSLYTFLSRTPESGAIYDGAMEDLARPVGKVLAKSRDFSGIDTVVDVGGGSGALLKGLLAVVPHLRGICVDRADVCARGAQLLAASGSALVGRLEFRAGDFFEALPPGQPLYLLKNVLHNWGDDRCVDLLRTVRVAMSVRPDARLLVIEPLAESAMPAMYKALDELMQVVISEPGVAARSESAFRALIERAGLRVLSVQTLASGHALIEATVQG